MRLKGNFPSAIHAYGPVCSYILLEVMLSMLRTVEGQFLQGHITWSFMLMVLYEATNSLR